MDRPIRNLLFACSTAFSLITFNPNSVLSQDILDLRGDNSIIDSLVNHYKSKKFKDGDTTRYDKRDSTIIFPVYSIVDNTLLNKFECIKRLEEKIENTFGEVNEIFLLSHKDNKSKVKIQFDYKGITDILNMDPENEYLDSGIMLDIINNNKSKIFKVYFCGYDLAYNYSNSEERTISKLTFNSNWYNKIDKCIGRGFAKGYVSIIRYQYNDSLIILNNKRFTKKNAVITIHELMHNLGASHDSIPKNSIMSEDGAEIKVTKETIEEIEAYVLPMINEILNNKK